MSATPLERWRTGLKELDFVVGGGFVPGSLTLIGGEPGIGKSTLLLQAAGRLEQSGRVVLYASGEESTEQLQLRAERLGGGAGAVHAIGETRLEAILEAAASISADVLVLDSIQTVSTDSLESAPGNVGQVRECAGILMRYAKASGTAVLVVGHVTKGGGIAGPKTLEHIVDTVLYFEGETSLDYRLLRATKNRFGPVDELGVFTMSEQGLVPVANPSALFLAARAANVSGSAVTALMEGTRPVLVEVQALAARAGYGTPQRVATGFDPRRLAVLLAVLERRAGISFADLDVFVQATAGVRLVEPGADMAIAAALLSSLNNRPAPADALFLGEIGLGGEIRPIGRPRAARRRGGTPRVHAGFRGNAGEPGDGRGDARAPRTHRRPGACPRRVMSASSSSPRGRERGSAATRPSSSSRSGACPCSCGPSGPSFGTRQWRTWPSSFARSTRRHRRPGCCRMPATMLSLVAGGAERSDSVAAGVAALPPACRVVLVHDAARPFVDAALIDRVIEGVRAGNAVVPAVAVTDTIKETDAADPDRIARTVPRESLRRVQTPQGFSRQVLEEAHARARRDGVSGTDDAALVERLGGVVRIVAGDPRNLKVTTAEDLEFAEYLARRDA